MERQTLCDLKYVKAIADRRGVVRYYFRRRGQYTRLPGEPGSAEFLAAYNAALETPLPNIEQSSFAPGSFDSLRVTYYVSAEFRNLAESTQREARYVIDGLAKRPNKSGGKNGDNQVATLTKDTVLKWRDALADKPGAANKMIGVLRSLLTWSVGRGYRTDNPALGIKRLKLGRFRSWTDEELRMFERRWPLGTVQRLGYALALYTAQRRSDLVAIKWRMIAGQVLRMRQRKTGTDLEIALHPELRKALLRTKRSGETILAQKNGAPLSAVYFGQLMASAIEEARLPSDCVLHGLRKTAARIVAELGGKVGSVTGHLSPQMEAEYARDANQARMNKDVIVKWGKKDRAPASANKPGKW